jgi:hypothetical protein
MRWWVCRTPRLGRIISQELHDLFPVLLARFVSSILPIRERALVYFQDFLAFIGWYLQVKTPLFDVFSDMAGMFWIAFYIP